MKNKVLLVLVFIIIFIIVLLTMAKSLQEFSSMELIKGSNQIEFNINKPFHVDTLVKLNPEIEAVSYEDEKNSFGYVNIHEGIGRNFIIENKSYEIFVSKNITLILPDLGG